MNCSFSFLFMILFLLKESNKVEPIPKPHLEKYNINSGNTNPNSRTGIGTKARSWGEFLGQWNFINFANFIWMMGYWFVSKSSILGDLSMFRVITESVITDHWNSVTACSWLMDRMYIGTMLRSVSELYNRVQGNLSS